LLTPAQFSVVHDKAAEPAAETFRVAESGVYACTCGQSLFEASAATEAQGTLAHFHRPVESAAVVTDVASAWSLDEEKVEVRCGMCGAHLGHVDSGQSAEDPLIFKLKPTALVWAGTAE
ncbi:MAG: peptide-methionine (R)-S-oxide reductase, partial [Acidobacteriota bacterium]